MDADTQTGMRYALDETLAALGAERETHPAEAAACAAFESAVKGHGLAALVLKPTLLGGFARCLGLCGRVPVHTEAVVSSAFESGLLVSFMAIATASAFGARLQGAEGREVGGGTAHGLSTFERLDEDVLVPPLAQLAHAGALSVARCERALADTVRVLGGGAPHALVSGPLGHEDALAILGLKAPPADAGGQGEEESEEALLMRRFGGF